MGEISRQFPGTPATAAEGPRQYLNFQLGGEMFAISILNIREIIEYGAVTEIPMMPRFLRGVINLRGAVVPVIDLLARFGQGQTGVGRRSCIVILEIPDGEELQSVGIMVDSVTEVLDIPAADIEPPPGFGTRRRADFISGMGRTGQGFVIILDPARVLSIEDLAGIAEMSAGQISADS